MKEKKKKKKKKIIKSLIYKIDLVYEINFKK